MEKYILCVFLPVDPEKYGENTKVGHFTEISQDFAEGLCVQHGMTFEEARKKLSQADYERVVVSETMYIET